MRAIDALYEAQKIAFAPFIFQTAYTMLAIGLLDRLLEANNGLTIHDMAEATQTSEYGICVLVEMAEASKIVKKTNSGAFQLTKIGYFLARDEKTRINIMFTYDICYKGLFHLHESIQTGKPAGLKEIGSWKTLYEGLSALPGRLKQSWFDFDHLYSDKAFDHALKYVFKDQPKRIFDIGGNTGKWAIACTQYDPKAQVTILDLPIQLQEAKTTIAALPHKVKQRIDLHEIDMLDAQLTFPTGADIYWMSQFLDCFSECEIETILTKIKQSAKPTAKIYIMELFIDNQRFEASKFSLVATSLYFTTIANGNSKMYSIEAFRAIIKKAGLKIVNEHYLNEHNFHTILEITLS